MGDHGTFDVLFYLMDLRMLSLGTLLPEEHTQTHTAHSGASRLTHPYKYIFPPPVMCSQQLLLLH